MDREKRMPRGIRLNEEIHSHFKEIAATFGGDQQATLARLIEVYELEAGKEALPEMRESIETFEGYIFAAVAMFRQSLEKNQDMRALVRTEYDALLKSKDVIIRELQEKLETAKEIADRTECMEQRYKSQLSNALNERDSLKNQIEIVRAEAKEKDAEWKSKYADLEEICDNLRTSETEAKDMVVAFMKENASLKEEIQAKKEEYQKERAELKVEIRELEAKIEESEGKLAFVQRDLTEQKQQYEICKATTGTELQLAVQKKENELRAEYKVEMDELRKELEKYRELYYKKNI